MSYRYWIVYEAVGDSEFTGESYGEDKRRIYTFDNEAAAHGLVEYIIKHDFLESDIWVEEYEAPAKL